MAEETVRIGPHIQLPRMMKPTPRHNTALLVLAATAWIGTANIATAQTAPANNFGTEVTNIATLTYTVGGDTTTVATDEAIFVIRPAATPATIEFFRFAPTAADPMIRAVNGSDYSPSGNLDGPFVTTGEPVTAGGALVDLTKPIPLIPATTYLAGELMFVRVTDMGQNLDSTAIDTLEITITADNGDEIVLRLYESGPDTGEFFAYLPSTDADTAQFDNRITASGNTSLTATYIDTFDSTDVVVDTAILNPLNRVFSSVSGEEVDGAVITLIDAATGEEATVFGVDAFSTFPAQQVSGSGSDDGAGLTYESSEGEFHFPIVAPGTYIIQVEPPEGFNFATVFSEDELADLSNQNGFVLTPGSFGQVFTVTESGPLRFDIPLDPESNLVVSKTADRGTADVGDYVNYTVTVRNQGQSSAPVRLYDTLPVGFRYVEGTTRVERVRSEDPTIADDAALLTFDAGLVAPGESVTVDYALLVGPGAHMGDAVNEAVVRDSELDPISNVARAAVTLREDLLRSTSTIIGRITEQSCQSEDDWARPIDRGIGVDGVRLYMETGAYVVSDADGLFHFEGVSEGVHVVQVDEETLPQGFELMKCEENTRYAGAMNSKFIDVQGGGIWRANFYLKQTGERAAVVEEEVFDDNTEHKDFDAAWLDTQDATPAWAYPATTRTPSNPSVHVGIKHAAGDRVTIRLNDRLVESYYYQGQTKSTAGTVGLSRWRGLPMQDGRNVFIATVKNADGDVVSTLREEIWYVKTIARAVPLPDQSTLIADGRTTPIVAIRMEDQSGRPVHAGRITEIDLEPPYRLQDENNENRLREITEDLTAPLSARRDFSVGPGGVLQVKLEPTLRTGKVTVIATLDNGRRVPIYMYLEPEKRDWILVGLAEGSAALQDIDGNKESFDGDLDDFTTDGRLAFFAKGLIKGNWLMTLAVDTDKRRGARDGEFGFEIDPNAYYTLYGDRTYQEFEGVSRYPLYVKLEKRQAYAMFGDYDTNITEGRLTSYSRRLTGLKAEYVGDDVQVLGFAAETNQGFAQDEIPADGLSGGYRLSNDRVLPQSEEIVVETRDRLRPDIVLDRKVLVRYLDYTLDYFTGEIIFRLPIDATDFDFNPNVIVVNYETSEDAERNITAGGRVQAQVLDGKLQVGSTFTHEDGSALTAGAEANQIGVDVIAQVTNSTQVRAEYAITENKDVDGLGDVTADAKLLEIVHTSEKLAAEAYFREEEGGFGLGQRTTNTAGVRRYGVRGSLKIHESDDEETGRRTARRVDAQVYREENLSNDSSRTSGELLAVQDGTKLDVQGGLRVTKDEIQTGLGEVERESLLVVGRASYDIPKHGMSVNLSAEQPLDGKDDVSAQPQKLALGINKRVGDTIIITARHEILNGAGQESTNTALGVSATPWSGGTATVASDRLTNDSGRRIGATVGLDQTVRLSENWTGTVGVRTRKVLDAERDFEEVAPDAAISAFEQNEDFRSAYIGAAYRTEAMSASGRGEVRETNNDTTYVASASVARELSETLSLAGAARARISDPANTVGTDANYDVRLGAAWRPRDEGTVVFDRLDLNHNSTIGGIRTTKAVNNLAMNTMIADNWQMSANWGTKYVKTEIGDAEYDNWTNLLGAETRFDVAKRIDVGLRGAVMHSKDAGTQYSWGPSIGVSPVDNVWVSAGYNVEGFKDRDFEAAEYAREGVYLQMRVKFDQDTARGLLRRISPSANVVGPRDTKQVLSQPRPEPRVEPVTIVAPTPAPAPQPVSDWEPVQLVQTPAPEPVIEPVPVVEPAPVMVVEAPVETVPAIIPSVERVNLNQCDRSAIALFDVDMKQTPKVVSRLGTMPQFGDSHGLTPAEFYRKLDTKYASDANDRAYLDYMFNSLGYENGWADARPDMFSDDVLPSGTTGLMGFGPEHSLQYSVLAVSEYDRQAFRVQSANGEVVHFMKACGNYMYSCETAEVDMPRFSLASR
jgi:uncharacterized repeat protein (TIGR01451 family)